MDNSYQINNCAVILLAAGASSRLGKPKQLLTYRGKSFLQHTLSVINEAGLNSAIVVLGSNASSMIHELDNEKIHITHNEGWQEGIASSIRSGINALQKNYPACDGTLIMLVDQPYITSALLTGLVEIQKQTGKPMAACEYETITGTPALFHSSLFSELLNLKGDKGAGKILQQRRNEVATIPFPLGRLDIDTEDDYRALQQNDPG